MYEENKRKSKILEKKKLNCNNFFLKLHLGEHMILKISIEKIVFEFLFGG